MAGQTRTNLFTIWEFFTQKFAAIFPPQLFPITWIDSSGSAKLDTMLSRVTLQTSSVSTPINIPGASLGFECQLGTTTRKLCFAQADATWSHSSTKFELTPWKAITKGPVFFSPYTLTIRSPSFVEITFFCDSSTTDISCITNFFDWLFWFDTKI
eukprot:Lithocolla_globosa_v1_NODE_4045_length_1521_cov_22.677353.p2 type:complete len:155 gc:universal NODE_4045_length_1521_cov_22.677353:1076-612(-)